MAAESNAPPTEAMYSGTTFDAAPAAATAGEKTAICGHSFSNIEVTSKMNFIFK